nr:unnamed protein product [Callosobruchus chinensis]
MDPISHIPPIMDSSNGVMDLPIGLRFGSSNLSTTKAGDIQIRPLDKLALLYCHYVIYINILFIVDDSIIMELVK